MSKSNLNRENLWEGKVSIRRNFISVKTRYAIIKEKKIIIRKNEKEESKMYEEIDRKDMISIKYPKFGAKEILLTGYKGVMIDYRKNDKKKTLSFWTKGFGAQPNQDEMGNFVEAITGFAGEKYDDVKDNVDTYSFQGYMFIVTCILFGYFIGGYIGIAVMGLASYLAIKVYKKESIAKDKRNLLSLGIISGGCLLTLLVSVLLGFIIGLMT